MITDSKKWHYVPVKILSTLLDGNIKTFWRLLLYELFVYNIHLLVIHCSYNVHLVQQKKA